MAVSPLIERLRTFEDFAAVPDDAASALDEQAQIMSVDAGRTLNAQGAPCVVFPLVLSGCARIFVTDADGREITLYRLRPGHGCVLAATCAVTGIMSPGFTVVETAGDAAVIPAEALRSWIDRFPFWRNYVFTLVARELSHVLSVTNDLAFRRLDSRIASLLLEQDGETPGEVRMTHEAVAREVGTRREVASRILKGLEQDGVVALERGVIRVRDSDALADRAGDERPR